MATTKASSGHCVIDGMPCAEPSVWWQVVRRRRSQAACPTFTAEERAALERLRRGD